jgi:hypothetical protein
MIILDDIKYEIPLEILLKVGSNLGIDLEKPVTSIVSVMSDTNTGK